MIRHALNVAASDEDYLIQSYTGEFGLDDPKLGMGAEQYKKSKETIAVLRQEAKKWDK